MLRIRRPPSQSRRIFLSNHAEAIASVYLFVVPTITLRMPFGYVVPHHGRRQLVHVGVTAHPTPEWLSHQISEAFPWDRAPRHLIRDRDRAFGEVFKHRLHAMGIRDRPTALRSPWQNAYAERLIGSIGRDCLDHLIIVDERDLQSATRLCPVLLPAAHAPVFEQGCPVGPTRAEPWGAAPAASFRRPALFVRADVVVGRDSEAVRIRQYRDRGHQGLPLRPASEPDLHGDGSVLK
jgi:hypothetical protein